ncbi:MAG: FHA domain-containing protein [Planctomycetota bacterium]
MLTLIHYDPEATGKPETYHVPGTGAWVIGRDRGDLVLTDSRVSRRHAEVSVQNGVFVIRDLGSSNGTWVNGRRVAGLAELEQGDRIQVGRVTLLVGQVGGVVAAGSETRLDTPADDTAAGWPGQSSSLALDIPEDAPDVAAGLSAGDTPVPSSSAVPGGGSARDPGVAEPPESPAPPPRPPRPESPLEVDADPPELAPAAEGSSVDVPDLVGLSLDETPPAQPEENDDHEAEDADLEVNDDGREDVDATGGGDGRDEAAIIEERIEVAWAEPSDPQVLSRRRTASGTTWAVAAAVLVLALATVGFYLLNRPAPGGPRVADRPTASTPRNVGPPRADEPANPLPDDVASVASPVATPPPPTASERIGPEMPATAADGPPEDAFGDSPALVLTPSEPLTPSPRVERTPLAETTDRGDEPLARVAVAVLPPEVGEPPESPDALDALDAPASSATPPDETTPSAGIDDSGPTGPTFADAAVEAPATTDVPAATAAAPPGATATRRVVYLIDASGSMVDSMNQGALTWLSRDLDRLDDGDAFAVLFFRGERVIEAPPAGMQPAGSVARVETLAWVAPGSGNIRPGGKSEPLAAVRRALSYGPTDLYLLSDDKFGGRGGRAGGNGGAEGVGADELRSLMGDDPPVVHTVQFFYRSGDDRTLERIAEAFGGSYEFVREPSFDASPGGGIDLFGASR